MIKIIKEGIKEFKATCPFCYCEFSYESEDLNGGMLNCPCCEAIIEAKSNTRPWPAQDNMIWETPEYKIAKEELKRTAKERDSVSSPCLTCDWHKQLMLGHTYVGDSPCQWCQYSGLKTTCNSTGSAVNGVK